MAASSFETIKCIDRYIQSFNEHLASWKVENRGKELSSHECRKMNEKYQEKGCDYNAFSRIGVTLLRSIGKVEEKIKALEDELETWRTKNVESEAEIELMKTSNMRSEDEVMAQMQDNKTLKDENGNSAEAIKTQKEEKTSISSQDNPQEAVALDVFRPPAPPVKDLGVKLLVFYWVTDISPVSCPEIQYRGEYRWCNYHYIKCQIPGIREGWTTFEELREFLTPMFTRDKKIRRIPQLRGDVKGKAVVQVTSSDKDEAEAWNESPYCGVDGDEQFLWEEVRMPKWRGRKEKQGTAILICGGGRRTVLEIEV